MDEMTVEGDEELLLVWPACLHLSLLDDLLGIGVM